MASLRLRGSMWWGKWKDSEGRLVEKSLGTRDAARAREIIREIEREVARQKAEGGTGPLTVAAYAKRWLEQRQNLTRKDNAGHLQKHILPRIGGLVLSEVRRSDVVRLIAELMKREELAAKTILNVYGTLSVMMAHAEADELIKTTPCTLDASRGELPLNRPARPRYWEEESYSMAEVVELISNPLVPEDRRVLYAIQSLAGLRIGEACALKVLSWRRDMTPLSGLIVEASYSPKRKEVGETKTGQTRGVPVHLEIAAVLEAWLAPGGGWERMAGRAPTPDDWLVPARALSRLEARLDPANPRTYSSALKQLHRDQELLGLRQRNEHALRAFFITWGAETAGINPTVFRWLTHGAERGTVTGRYTRPQWESRCAEVAKLKLVRPGGDHAPMDSIELPHATRGLSGQDAPGGSLPGGLPTPAAPASGRRAIGHPDGAPRDGSRDPAPAPLVLLTSAVTPEAQTSEGRGQHASDRANLPEGASPGTPSGPEDAGRSASRVQPAEWPVFVRETGAGEHPGRRAGAVYSARQSASETHGNGLPVSQYVTEQGDRNAQAHVQHLRGDLRDGQGASDAHHQLGRRPGSSAEVTEQGEVHAGSTPESQRQAGSAGVLAPRARGADDLERSRPADVPVLALRHGLPAQGGVTERGGEHGSVRVQPGDRQGGHGAAEPWRLPERSNGGCGCRWPVAPLSLLRVPAGVQAVQAEKALGDPERNHRQVTPEGQQGVEHGYVPRLAVGQGGAGLPLQALQDRGEVPMEPGSQAQVHSQVTAEGQQFLRAATSRNRWAILRSKMEAAGIEPASQCIGEPPRVINTGICRPFDLAKPRQASPHCHLRVTVATPSRHRCQSWRSRPAVVRPAFHQEAA